MTATELQNACQNYLETVLAKDAPERCRFPFPTEQIRRAHLAWMCHETCALVDSAQLEKALRWLGFIQGTLWALELSTEGEP